MYIVNAGWLEEHYPECYELVKSKTSTRDVKSLHFRRRVFSLAVGICVQLQEKQGSVDIQRFHSLLEEIHVPSLTIRYLPPLTSRIGTPGGGRRLTDVEGYEVTPALLAEVCEQVHFGFGSQLAEVLVHQYFKQGRWSLPHNPEVVLDAVRSEEQWWREDEIVLIWQSRLGPHGETLPVEEPVPPAEGHWPIYNPWNG